MQFQCVMKDTVNQRKDCIAEKMCHRFWIVYARAFYRVFTDSKLTYDEYLIFCPICYDTITCGYSFGTHSNSTPFVKTVVEGSHHASSYSLPPLLRRSRRWGVRAFLLPRWEIKGSGYPGKKFKDWKPENTITSCLRKKLWKNNF